MNPVKRKGNKSLDVSTVIVGRYTVEVNGGGMMTVEKKSEAEMPLFY